MPFSRREAHAIPRTPRKPGRGGSFSAAARRRIRHAAALAEEMGNVHSIEAFGVVWTFHRPPHKSGGNRGGQERQQTPRQQNAHQQRSQERAAAYRARCAAADSFRVSRLFSTWRHSAFQEHLRARAQRTQRRSQDTSDATPKPLVAAPRSSAATNPAISMAQRPPPDAQADGTVHAEGHALLLPPPVPPLPPSAPAASPPSQTQQQGGEPMQSERAKNARRRSPAADAGSPAGAHARVRRLELPPPPP